MIYFRLSNRDGFHHLRECAPGEAAGWIAFAERFHFAIELWSPE